MLEQPVSPWPLYLDVGGLLLLERVVCRFVGSHLSEQCGWLAQCPQSPDDLFSRKLHWYFLLKTERDSSGKELE